MKKISLLGFLVLLFSVNTIYCYDISSLIITITKEKIYLTISANVNKSLHIREIVPSNCKITQIYSSVPYYVEDHVLYTLGIKNKTYNILIKVECLPEIETTKYKFVYYLNNVSRPVDIYLIYDENIKIEELTPKFKIENGIFYSSLNGKNCNEILIKYKVLKQQNILIFYLILVLPSLILLFSLILIFKKYKKKIIEEQRKEKILLNALKHCKTDLEKKIIEYLYNKNFEAYQFEIYKDLKLDKSTVSKILKRLEEKGIIERKPGKKGILVKLKDQLHVEDSSTQHSNR